MIKIITLTILIVILILCKIKFTKNHIYWDKQPVSRNQKENTMIQNTTLIKTLNTTPEGMAFLIKRVSEFPIPRNVLEFISVNFSEYDIYSHDYIKWSTCYLDTIMVVLYNHPTKKYYDNIIGTIFGKITTIIFENIPTYTLNVEFLCVKKSNRNKRITPILVDKMVRIYADLGFKFAIFTKDVKPLPFDYFSEASYYHLFKSEFNNVHINNIFKKKIKMLNFEENSGYFIKIYNFMYNELKKYRIYEKLNLKSFRKYLDNKNMFALFGIDNNENIEYIVIFTKKKYIHPKTKEILDAIVINYLLSSLYDKELIMYNLLKYFNKIDIITCLNIAGNDIMINKFKFNKGINIYYHAFNYSFVNINKYNNALIFS